jgi:pyruvate dehydrogenase E2 component (dihydrolipoamide acetyltransferase)
MAEKIMMLALSPTMEAGTIIKWNFAEGDKVSDGDVICEVETDKTNMDYELDQDGTLLKIVQPVGGKAKVGDTIAILGDEGEDITELLASVGSAAASEPEAEAKVETEAAEEASEEPVPVAKKTVETAEKTSMVVSPGGKIIASPLARKLAGEYGLDIRVIQGSGPGGRIVKRDIEAALQSGGGQPSMTRPQFQPVTAGASDEKLPISQKRAIIAQRLAESKYSAPHYYLTLSIAMDQLLAARKQLNARMPDNKISVNALLIKFSAEALKRHAQVNSTWNGDHILQHGSIDIGLAVAQPDGLITPVVRNCGQKGILQIESELRELIDKALNNRLTPDEFSGATFTISNLGSFGIEEFTAIINPPGSAILAVGMSQKQPVVDLNDELIIKTMMKVTLSCDHRIVDGAIGAAFLKDLKDMMEDPIRTLL